MSNHLSFSIFTIVSIIAKQLKMMKAKFVYMLLLLGLMCSTCCSEDFFLDDYEGECWNGQGLPSWINEKNENYKQKLDPHYDCVNPHSDYLLCNLYRFKYQKEWYIAMASERCYPSFLEPENNKFSYIIMYFNVFFYGTYDVGMADTGDTGTQSCCARITSADSGGSHYGDQSEIFHKRLQRLYP